MHEEMVEGGGKGRENDEIETEGEVVVKTDEDLLDKPAEPAEPAESAESAESVEPAEPAEPAGPAEPSNSNFSPRNSTSAEDEEQPAGSGSENPITEAVSDSGSEKEKVEETLNTPGTTPHSSRFSAHN